MRELFIEAAARELIGTPFQHQGRTKGVGMDCVGVVVHIARKFGLADQYDDKTDYSRIPDREMQALLATHLDRVTWNDRRPGDVVHISWESKIPQHVGILTGNDTFIHSLAPRGVIETHIGGPMRVAGVYRFRES